MPNEIVDLHRKNNPSDTRSDSDITASYYTHFGQGWMEQNAEKYPDFYRDYRSMYYGNENEFTKGVTRGYEGLKSTAMGGIGLALDAVPGEVGFVEDLKKSALEKATQLGERASGPLYAPRERAFKNVDSVGGALEYTGALMGESVPSLAESVVIGGVGALAGSAVAPGPGTVTGAVGGFVTKQAAKKILQKAVKNKLEGLSGNAVARALKNKGDKKVIEKVNDLVQKQAKSMTSQYGALTANALNSYGLSSGEIYNELANDPNVDPDDAFNTAISFGAIAAAPDTVLPSVVLNKMGIFDKIAGLKKAAGKTSSKKDKKAFKEYLIRFMPEVAKNSSIEGVTEGFQEYVNISASKFAKGEGIDSPFNLTEEEYGRIQRAGAMGIAGGFTVSPLSAINVKEEAADYTTKDEPDKVVGTDEEGRPIREVSPKKKLTIPTPTAEPLTAEEEAEVQEVALLYIQGEHLTNPEVASRARKIRSNSRAEARWKEVVLDYRRQIQAGVLTEDGQKLERDIEELISKVEEGEELTDEEAAFLRDEAEKKGGNLSDEERNELLKDAAIKGLLGEEAKRKAESSEEEQSDDSGQKKFGIKEYDEYKKKISFVAVLAKVLRREPLTQQEADIVEKRGGSTIEQDGQILGVLPEEAVEDVSDLEFPIVLFDGETNQEAEQPATQDQAQDEVKQEEVTPTVTPTVTPQETASEIVDVEPIGEDESTDLSEEVEYDYNKDGKKLKGFNPVIQSVKKSPAPKPQEANKFTQASIDEKKARTEAISNSVQNLISLNQKLEEKYNKTSTTEEERKTLLFSMKETSRKLEELTNALTINNKRIDQLTEQLIPEDQFIDVDTQQEVTSATLTEESLDYEGTVPTRVQVSVEDDVQKLIDSINSDLESEGGEQAQLEELGYTAVYNPNTKQFEAKQISIDKEAKSVFKDTDARVTGGKAAPAFYAIDPTKVENFEQAEKELSEKGQSINDLETAPDLDAQSQIEKGQENDVRRLTAFYNKKTGEVFVLGTGKRRRAGKDKGKISVFANVGKGKTSYLTLSDIKEQGDLIPFASMRLISPRSKPVFYYGTLQEFNNTFGNAEQRTTGAITAQNSAVAAVEDSVGDVDTAATPDVVSERADQFREVTDLEALLSRPEIADELWEHLNGDNDMSDDTREILALAYLTRLLARGQFSQFLEDGSKYYESYGLDGSEFNLEDDRNGVVIRALDLLAEEIDPMFGEVETRDEFKEKIKGFFPDSTSQVSGRLEAESEVSGQGLQDNEAVGERAGRVKQSPAEEVDPTRPSDAQIKQRFVAALQSLAAAGVDIQVLTNGLSQQMGMYVDQAIQLVISDLANPTIDTIRLLLHEGGHSLFDQLPAGLQEVFHNAIENLTDEQLQVDTEKLSRNIAPDNDIDETTQEERLVDSVAKELAESGFDPSQARTMVQQLMDFLRRLYLRSYIEVQKALRGPEFVNGERARQYFKLRLESYLTSNYSNNAISMMGGAPLTAESLGQLKRGDKSEVTKVYDFNSGIVELKEIEPESLQDILWNSKRRVKFLEDGTAEEIPIDIKPELNRLLAIEKYMSGLFEDMFTVYNESGQNVSGISLSDFIRDVLGVKKGDSPIGKIEAFINEGADADVTIDTLESTQARPLAARAIYTRMRRMRSKMDKIRGNAISNKTNSLINKADKITDKLKEFQKKYTDITTYTNGIASVIDQALKEYAKSTKSSKPHSVTTILKILDPKYKFKDYKKALQDARKKVLVMDDVLVSIGEMDLDFENTDPEQLALEIRNKLASTSLSKSVEDNVIIASLLGFSKRYPEAMTLLQLRGEKNRGNVDTALNLMLSDNEAGISEARRLLRETITKTRQGERLHQRILALKRKLRSHLTQFEKAQKNSEAMSTVAPVLTQREQEVSSIFGGERAVSNKEGKVGQFEAMHDTFINVPENEDSTIEEITKSTLTINISQEEDYGRISDIIRKQGEWLVKNGEQGEMNALIKRQRDHLIEMQADFTQRQVQLNFVTRLIGDVASKMEGLGGPKGRALSKRVRKFVSFMQTYGGSRTSNKGVAWANAEHKAIKALGKPTLSEFRERFYDPFFTFASENSEILEMYPGNPKAAENELFRRAKIYMGQLTDGESDQAWGELVKLYSLSGTRNGYINQIRSEMGVKVLDEIKVGKETFKFFRETIGSPLFSLMRRTKESLEVLYGDMDLNWNGGKNGYLSLKKITQAIEEGTISELLGGRFDAQTIDEFVVPLINRSKSSFSKSKEAGGDPYSQAEVQEAWESTKGLEGNERIIAFATSLSESSDSSIEAQGEIINTFNIYFKKLEEMYSTKEENKSKNPVPVHTMMDARVSQDFPNEWLEYSTYTEREMRYYAESLSYEAAYGRDLVGIYRDFDSIISELRRYATQYEKIQKRHNNNKSISSKERNKRIRADAKKNGGIRVLKDAAKNLQMVETEKKNFDTILQNKRDQIEYGAFIELVSAMTGATVQGVSTALTDLSTAIEGPFRNFGLSTFAVSALFKNVKYTALEAIGTLIQVLPVSWNVNSDRVRRRTRLGLVDDDSMVSFRERYVSNMQDEFRSKGMTGKVMETISRTISTLLNVGIGKAKDKKQLYTTLKAAPFTMFVNWQTAGVTDSNFDVFTDFAARAGEFFANNPEKMNDPSYQLTAKDMGLNDRLFGLIQNEKGFDYIVNTFQQHGLNATELGREWVSNGKQNPLTDEHYRRIASVTATEMMLENTTITQPSWMQSNKLAVVARPLLRWGVAKTADLAKRLPKLVDRENLDITDPDTIKALKAYRNFALGMGMAIVPLSLAWAMVRDEYDEELLGKRGNLMRFGEANPFFVLLDRLDRVGTFGMAGEIANTTLNMNNARQFGIDNRVFAVNSALSLGKALGTWIRQGDATYATVGRPAMMAFGFGGALQNFQLSNNLLGLDNAESRYVARINVNNILRATGKELSLDVKNFSGGGALPTPMKPWISEMVLSAYANDGFAFKKAYKRALEAAGDMGKEDPEKSVKSSLTMYHPLRYIYRTPPLASDFNKILNAAGDGRQAINESIQLFNKYAETIGINPYMGKAAKKNTVNILRSPSMKGLTMPGTDYRSFSVDSSSSFPF